MDLTIEKLYEIFLQHPTVTTDSRECPDGSLFFALKGDNFNGNTFALSALQKGCYRAVVDEAKYVIDDRFILVSDVLDTLQRLAAYHRKQMKIPVIGITGTNGKTTTKELIACVLQKKYKVLYTQGNLNNHIGVPLTLLRLNSSHTMAVIEMGANHLGEINALVNIAQPNFGLITNIGKAHLEGFGSFEGVLATKGELYDYLRQTGGIIFRNENVECLKRISDGIETVTYGVETDSTFVSGRVEANSPYLSLSWTECGQTKRHHVSTHFIGAYNAANMMAAVAVGRYFGVSAVDINVVLSSYVPQNNRSQLLVTEHNTLVVDAYNANPTSMDAALRNFQEMDFPQKAVILGDMLELGDQSDAEHRAVVDFLRQAHFDAVFLVGKCFAKVGSEFPAFADVADLTAFLAKNPLKDKAILIKGSHGIGLQKLVDKL